MIMQIVRGSLFTADASGITHTLQAMVLFALIIVIPIRKIPREAIESLVGGPFDWTPLSSEDDGRENVAIYNTEAWRSGAPDNMYGIRGAFLVLGRDGEELCDVIDPRGVCRMLGGRKAEAYGQPGGA